jgi:hypothetical protein
LDISGCPLIIMLQTVLVYHIFGQIAFHGCFTNARLQIIQKMKGELLPHLVKK